MAIEYIIQDMESKKVLPHTIEVDTPIQIGEQIEGVFTKTDICVVKGLGRAKKPGEAKHSNKAQVLKLKD